MRLVHIPMVGHSLRLNQILLVVMGLTWCIAKNKDFKRYMPLPLQLLTLSHPSSLYWRERPLWPQQWKWWGPIMRWCVQDGVWKGDRVGEGVKPPRQALSPPLSCHKHDERHCYRSSPPTTSRDPPPSPRGNRSARLHASGRRGSPTLVIMDIGEVWGGRLLLRGGASETTNHVPPYLRLLLSWDNGNDGARQCRCCNTADDNHPSLPFYWCLGCPGSPSVTMRKRGILFLCVCSYFLAREHLYLIKSNYNVC